jgi:hypothetical protein
MNKEELKLLIEKGYTNQQLAYKYNCSVSTIRRYLKTNNLQREVSSHPNLKTNQFKNIDTKEKAYWLGFLYADGCVIFNEVKKTYTVVLDLGIKDLESVERFCDFMGGDKKKISTITRKGIYISKRVGFYSKSLCQYLIDLGCTPRKSLTIRLPKLKNKELYKAFLLGYYDGDGFEHSCEIVCGHKLFLIDIKNKFNVTFDIKTRSNAFTLNLGSKFLKSLFDNYENSMPRKRKAYTHKYKYVNKGGVSKINPKFNVSKEELETLLKENSYCAIGRMFGVSDNAIRKRAKKYGIIF